jgi:hypothetical protein
MRTFWPASAIIAASLVGAAGWAASSHSADGSSAPPVQHCGPLITNWASVYEQCFQPAQLGQAQAAFSASPLDPRPAIRSVLHLHVRQVLLDWRIDHGPRAATSIGQGTPLSITYIFGTIPGGLDMVPMPSPASPHYAIVTESPMGRGGSRTRSISRAAGTVGGPHRSTTPVHGAWQLDMHLPNKEFSLSVVANVDKPVMERLAKSLVLRERSR